MLSVLRIKNFALIDQLELEFGAGLNVLTGETGAGKSIILDAIDAVLGGRVNSRVIRIGSRKALVEAAFNANQILTEWLKKQEIDPLDDESIVCSREITLTKSGARSRSRINGVLVNRQLMEDLRDRLVEIAAQGQTVQLMIPEKQRQLLDLYGGESLHQQRQQVAVAYEKRQQIKQALEKRRSSEQQRLQRLDWLEYQLQELKAAELTEANELEELLVERDRLSHVVELQQLSYQVYQLLYQNDHGTAVSDLLGEGEALLTDMTEYDRDLEPILEMVKAALTGVVEAGREINAYGDGLEADPERLGEVEGRIRTLKQICRKYGFDLADAIAHNEKLQQELDELTDSEHSLEKLEQELLAADKVLLAICEQLSKLRQKAAQKLEKQLVKELKPLAMDKVVFQCQIKPCSPQISGADRVEFYFSPNPGEEIQPLSSTASGGEMSRFLLALKACFSAVGSASTLIFDEIDAGVSGKVAGVIADKLQQLGQKNQVLCVTHQPLVAAMADSHFQVSKQIIEEPVAATDNGSDNLPEIRTVVRVKALNNYTTRRDELAQITGGHSASEAIAFAESLLTKAAAQRLKNQGSN